MLPLKGICFPFPLILEMRTSFNWRPCCHYPSLTKETRTASSVRSGIWSDSPHGCTTITKQMEKEKKHKVCGKMGPIPSATVGSLAVLCTSQRGTLGILLHLREQTVGNILISLIFQSQLTLKKKRIKNQQGLAKGKYLCQYLKKNSAVPNTSVLQHVWKNSSGFWGLFFFFLSCNTTKFN